MTSFKYIWAVGLAATALIIILPIMLLAQRDPGQPNPADPWTAVSPTPPPTNHIGFMTGPFESGTDVTAACLDCHENAAHELMQTVHWTWESKPLALPDRDELVTIGKANQINNYCIGIAGNWQKCTACHAGYGWEDDSFDFEDETKVDCLVCHADTGIYRKGDYGLPLEGVDLLAAAESVGRPTRQNCGSCHFSGGGGDAVKHGDLDPTLSFPSENLDVHMGRLNFQCVDCHQTTAHQIPGHAISVNPLPQDDLSCSGCHTDVPHQDQRINLHLDAIACQTCHVPVGAPRIATKMDWDWSTAGQDLLDEDPYIYMKMKGNFIYEQRFTPTYAWYNGYADRYILGDEIDPGQVTLLNRPLGDINDPTAKIWPFKVHTGQQPYDAINNYFLVPVTAGEGGYWHDYNWDQSFALNVANTGLEYSGAYGFAPTAMYWTMTHMVTPKEQALQCTVCHGDNSRMDWTALGYYGDPIFWGGRE